MFEVLQIRAYGKRPNISVLLYGGPSGHTVEERAVIDRWHPGMTDEYIAWSNSSTESVKVPREKVIFVRTGPNGRYDPAILGESVKRLFEMVDRLRDNPLLPGLGRLCAVGKVGASTRDPDGWITDLRRWWTDLDQYSLNVYVEQLDHAV